ncbi:ATP-binding cassette domain-containing protein [Streptococcus pluranimalium]
MVSNLVMLTNVIVEDNKKILLDIPKLTIPKSSFTAIIGESGGGKTLLSQTILGILPDNLKMTGQITKNYQKDDLIFQRISDNLQDNWTIGKLFHHLLISYGIRSESERHQIIETTLSLVNFANLEVLSQKSYQLSGGMAQKIAIALSLLSQPDFLVADEPTSALDSTSSTMIMELLQQLNQESGQTILLISHDLNLIKNYVSHIGIIKSGQLIEFGTKERILNKPQETYTKELMNLFRGNYFKR